MIKPEYLPLIQKNRALRSKIMLVTGMSESTVTRWIRQNSKWLTTEAVVRLICKDLNVESKDLFEPSKKILV